MHCLVAIKVGSALSRYHLSDKPTDGRKLYTGLLLIHVCMHADSSTYRVWIL